MSSHECNFERGTKYGFQIGFSAGLAAGAAGALPSYMFADAEMSRRFGLDVGEYVKVYYDDSGTIIGALSAR